MTPAANIKPLARTAAGSRLGLRHQTDRLDGKDRKHAGHQIQNQPAKHREKHERDEPRGPGRCGGRTRRREPGPAADAARRRAAEDRPISMGTSMDSRAALSGRAALLGRNQNAADVAGVRRLIAELHGELDGAVAPAQRLRRGILDHAVVERIERQRFDAGERLAPLLAEGDHELPVDDPGAARRGRGTGQLSARRDRTASPRPDPWVRPPRLRAASRRDRRSRECTRPHIRASLPSP